MELGSVAVTVMGENFYLRYRSSKLENRSNDVQYWKLEDIIKDFNSFKQFVIDVENKYETLGEAAIDCLDLLHVKRVIPNWNIDPFKKESK